MAKLIFNWILECLSRQQPRSYKGHTPLNQLSTKKKKERKRAWTILGDKLPDYN